MKQIDKYLDSVSIDSFKYRIQLNELDSYCQSLLDKYAIINVSTSEIEDDFNWKLRAKKISSNGVTIHIAIEKNQIVSLHKSEDVLVVLINAKMHKGIEYFNGINSTNIVSIYKQLMALELFKCSLSTFLNCGKVTDCDFKLDSRLNDAQYNEVLKQMKLMAKFKANVPIRDKFKGKGNRGIQFNERKADNCISNPFLKLYRKTADLMYNSTEFANEYLSDINTKDISRIETTVKNKKHFKSLGINDNSLNTVLNLPDETRNNILKSAVKKYVNTTKKIKTKMKNPNELTPTENLICQGLIATMEGFNMTFDKAVKFQTNGIENKTSRYRMKALLERIYLGQIKGLDLDQRLEQTDTYFRLLGIN
jgi:hypothetical protein